MPTEFWLIRHALVERGARARLYGVMDVALCPDALVAEADQYRRVAAVLPRPAHWVVSPLSRTQATATALFAAGYPAVALLVEPDLIEQHLGAWQGVAHAALPAALQMPPHPFWPLGPDEQPPGGERFSDVLVRVGAAMERLAVSWAGEAVVIVSHGGAIRAAIAHALGIGAGAALHFAIHNLSLTRLEHGAQGWRVLGVNKVYDRAA